MPRKKEPETKEPVKEVPLWERDDLVFEKVCPQCGTLNYSSVVRDKGTPGAAIMFVCRECSTPYKNWWYGSGPSLGGDLVYHEILRKPFKVICLKSDKGITVECIYEAFESIEDPDAFVILENDCGWKNTEYPKSYFIADRKKR